MQPEFVQLMSCNILLCSAFSISRLRFFIAQYDWCSSSIGSDKLFHRPDNTVKY